MSLTDEDLQAIARLLKPIQSDMQEVKGHMENVEQRMKTIENDIREVKSCIENVENNVQNVERHLTGVELALENETNHNIQLLAENHMNLIDKLNQSIKVADKTLMYEVQLSSVKFRIDSLEKEMAKVKKDMAL
ncbi:MAG: hypothetical protein HFH64_09945 [Lachnospiraceae bacterium]|nr:hypothetical protein [Lachnospiraceae bacterium]